MSDQFGDGYALLIGVGESAVAEWALPAVAMDVQALAQVLVHPERCGYPPEHVQTLLGKDATRANILTGLDWLQTQISAHNGENTTVVLYYSGHGWLDAKVVQPTYYLIPYDVRVDRLRTSALRGEDFAEAVTALTPARLLVILDCCHAGGVGVKGFDALPEGYHPLALAPDQMHEGKQAKKAEPQIVTGAGRAVLSSSQGEQRSYVRPDQTMSIFTYHLIEALTGHAQPAGGAHEVLVSDVMSYVTRKVPESARQLAHAVQTPDFRVTGNFPVALLLGGKGLIPDAAPPDPLAPLPGYDANELRSGDVYRVQIGAIGEGSQIAIGSNITQTHRRSQ